MPKLVKKDASAFEQMLGKQYHCPRIGGTYEIDESDRDKLTTMWLGGRDDGYQATGIPCPCGRFVELTKKGKLVHL